MYKGFLYAFIVLAIILSLQVGIGHVFPNLSIPNVFVSERVKENSSVVHFYLETRQLKYGSKLNYFRLFWDNKQIRHVNKPNLMEALKTADKAGTLCYKDIASIIDTIKLYEYKITSGFLIYLKTRIPYDYLVLHKSIENILKNNLVTRPFDASQKIILPSDYMEVRLWPKPEVDS